MSAMWRDSAMAEPSTSPRPGASGTYTRRKLGEKLYLQSADFDLRDPNCHSMKPSYHSLHDPHLNGYLHRRHIHSNLKERNLITSDDMVVCSRKEYCMYQDYVDGVKNDFKNKQQRERQKTFLELEEQGLISNKVTGEDIRTFLLTNELPRHDGTQQQHGLEKTKKSTKRTIKEKDGLLNGGKLPSITTQQTSAQDRTRLHLIENETKHELNRNRYMRDLQEKRSQREKRNFERWAAVQQAEVDKLTKTLGDLKKMRVYSKVETKLLNQVLGNSTSVKSSQKTTVPMQSTLRSLAPLPAKGHDITNQTPSADTKTRSLSVGTPYPKLPCLGKVRLPTNQLDPEADNKARITRALLDHLSSDSFQMQIAECIRNDTMLTSYELSPHRTTRVLGGKLATDILLCLFRTVRPSKLFVESSEHQNQTDTTSAKQFHPYVTEIINSVLQEIRVKVLEGLRSGYSQKISPQAFQRALNGLSSVLQNLETDLMETISLAEAIAADIYEQAPRTEAPVEESGTGTITYQVEAISGDLIRIAHESIACSSSSNEARTSKSQRLSGNTSGSESYCSEEDSMPYVTSQGSTSDVSFSFAMSPVVHSQVELETEAINAPIVKKADVAWEALDHRPFEVANKTKTNMAKISYHIYPPTMADASSASSSSSSCSVAVFWSEECGSVSLQESSLERSSDEVETLASASGALSGSSTPASSLEVLKTGELHSVILQEAKVSSLEISSNEVETLASASGALSGSPTPASSLEVLKTEESHSVIVQEAEVSSLEISSNEVETLAGAGGALSGSSTPASSLEVFKTEESHSVTLQEAEVSSLEMSAEVVEMLAGASPALSGASSSSGSEVFKTKESLSFIFQEAKVSSQEISSHEVETLAGASGALSGSSTRASSLEVFKTEDPRSVIFQEAKVSTLEISSNEVEMLAGASSAPSVASSSPTSSQCSQLQEIQLNAPSFALDSTGSDTNRVYNATKTQSLPCLYPAIANEVTQYFTTSFKDRITQAVKNELKRTFSAKEWSSTAQPKLGPEEKRAIRTMLKTMSKELNDLMSREHILSLLSVETAACGSPEHDVLLDQLSLAESQLIEVVFSEVKENLATKIHQESSKRGVSPLASQTAMKAVCKSLEDIKRTLIGDEMCVASGSGIQLSVSSEDTNVVPEMSHVNNRLPEAKTPSTISLSSQNSASHAATVSGTRDAPTKSLSLPNFYPIIANEVLQHFSTTTFKDNVRQILKKEYRRSRSTNDITSSIQQKQGPEERHFTRDMLRCVSAELNASISRHNVSLSPETPRPSSAPQDGTLQRLNAVASELVNRVYGQVKDKLTAAIRQESPKRGSSPVASQTAVNAACRTLNVIEMTLMDGARCPSTPPSLQKSKDLESETPSDDLIEDVISVFFLETGGGGGTCLNEVIKQSVSMSPTGSKAHSPKSPDDTNVSLTLGSFTHLLPRIADEILEHFSTAHFKECIIQSVKNVIRQRESGVSIKEIMEVIVKSVYHKMVLLLNRNTEDTQSNDYDTPKPVEDPRSAHELANTIKQITVAVLNHLTTQLNDKIKHKSNSLEESELVINALSDTLRTMVACISNIPFFSEEFHISKINNVPTQKLIGQWVSLYRLDFVSICLASSVLDAVYRDDGATTSNSKTSQSDLEANSHSSGSMIAPSKPASPANKRSFRARKWSSCSAFQKSADTDPDITVHSKSLEDFSRNDMESENEDLLESLSSEPMSMSSSVSSLEENTCRSHIYLPVLHKAMASKSVMNFMEEMQIDYTMQPKPPCKSDQSLQKLPVETKKSLGKRRMRLHKIFCNPEEFSDEESSNTSFSAPEDLHSSSSEEDL